MKIFLRHLVMVAALSVIFAWGTAMTQDLLGANPASDVDVLQMLDAENLDSIELNSTAYFLASDGKEAIVSPGHYRVKAEDNSQLRLISRDEEAGLLVQGLPMDHTDEVPVPVALSVPAPEQRLHIVLLFPGGTGLEAIGSLSPVRTRGEPPARLSPSQIHQALIDKVSAMTPSHPAP